MVAPDQTLLQLAEINRATGLAHESLLADVFLIERIPAWHSNHLERLTSQPKRVMLDSGFVGAAVGADRSAVLAEKLGDRLVAAAVLHTGPRRFPLGEGVDAIPISEIWT